MSQLTEALYVVYVWRPGEDFPEVLRAVDACIVDHDDDAQLVAAIAEAEAIGPYRVVKIRYPLDTVELFATPEITATVEERE